MGKRAFYSWKGKIITIGFITMNVFLFIISAFSGNLLYNEGAFSLRYLLQGQEWWRFITSMFLHADIDHLVGNMLMLYLAGELVERYIGTRKYIALYFVSGIAGSALYAAYEFYTNHYVNSIGASGAVFGIVGALFAIVLRHKGRYGGITIGRMGLMIVYMGYMGLCTSNVNNVAHIGGLLSGIVLMGFYMLARDLDSGRRYE